MNTEKAIKAIEKHEPKKQYETPRNREKYLRGYSKGERELIKSRLEGRK